jgi:hypothetical protein
LLHSDIILYRKLANAAIELEKYKKKAIKKKKSSGGLFSSKDKDKSKEKTKSKSKEKSKEKSSSSSKEKEKSKSKEKEKSKEKSKPAEKEKSKSKEKSKDKKEEAKEKKPSKPGFFERLFSSSSSDSKKSKSTEVTEMKSVGSKSSSKAAADDASESESESVQLTDDAAKALRELYSAIGFDDVKKKQQYPPAYIHTKVGFSMTSATIELRESINENSLLAAVVLDGAKVSLGLREEESLSLSATLHSVKVEDFFTMRSTVMKLNGGKLDPAASRLEIVRPDASRITDLATASLVSVNIDVNPPLAAGADKASNPDIKIAATVLPLAVTFSRPLIDRISYLFAPSKKNGEAAQSVTSVVTMVASDTIDTVKRRAENSIKYALVKRQIIGLFMSTFRILFSPSHIFPSFRYRCGCHSTQNRCFCGCFDCYIGCHRG